MIRPEDTEVDISVTDDYEESECMLRFWPGSIPIGGHIEAGEYEVQEGQDFIALLVARGTRAGFLEGMYLALQKYQ